jgi:hypothetical protein
LWGASSLGARATRPQRLNAASMAAFRRKGRVLKPRPDLRDEGLWRFTGAFNPGKTLAGGSPAPPGKDGGVKNTRPSGKHLCECQTGSDPSLLRIWQINRRDCAGAVGFVVQLQ